jgi:hypothetical protein
MTYRSPYRGDQTFSPRTRAIISRGTMLLIGLVLLYWAFRGGMALQHIEETAATLPTLPGPQIATRSATTPVLPWMILIFCGGLGLITTLAAVVPTSAIQAVFETFYEPTALGDRSGENVRRHWIVRLLRLFS